MNIINIVNNKISNSKINNKIKLKENKNICIDIIDNTKLYIEIDGINIKSNIDINIDENVNSRIFVFSNSIDSKININVNQNKNSNLILNSFYKNDDVKENTIINLNGYNSNIEYNYSCIGKTNKSLRINHYFSKTNSIVKNRSVSNNDEIEFEIIEYVPKGSIDCNLSQSSKIINLKENKCKIKPILLIDEKEVNASHSSVISPINDSDLLYLMSRGIDEHNSINLLVNGFLVNNLNLNEEEKHILFEKYIFRR
ncbi:MAG: SufD family Fe-S cluster assembly protein [Bacilli bacterium]|nr:SufD family Fe-S cluster assembly protein [Bacilli bacterium]